MRHFARGKLKDTILLDELRPDILAPPPSPSSSQPPSMRSPLVKEAIV